MTAITHEQTKFKKTILPQYGSVFGFAFLAAFISAPVFGAYGDRIGAKLLYNGAGFLQGLSGVLFGLLSFVEDKSTFLACSYLLRYFDRNYLIKIILLHSIS